jgi:NADP+-dependent farnesol dehydrogenase
MLKGQLTEARGKLVPMECHVRDEGHVNPVFRWIGENYDGIDLLINIANSMTRGFILQDDNTEDMRKIMETNIMGLCLVTREAVKLMKMRKPERKNIGHIINITSTIGQIIGNCAPTSKPLNGLYPASK